MATELEQLKIRLRALRGMKVTVGVQGENAARVHPNGGGQTVGEIALANHYGTSNAPARPFLTVTLARRKADISRVFAAAVKSGRTPQEIGDLVGLYVVGAVQETISDGVPPPNAPSTIERKGSSTPLIDTGILRQSINHEVKL